MYTTTKRANHCTTLANLAENLVTGAFSGVGKGECLEDNITAGSFVCVTASLTTAAFHSLVKALAEKGFYMNIL